MWQLEVQTQTERQTENKISNPDESLTLLDTSVECLQAFQTCVRYVNVLKWLYAKTAGL